MKILIFDNYDSFTYNLVHYVESLTDAKVDVFRNDKIALKEIEKYDKILLSPGPGLPAESGILTDLIKQFAPTKSIFGVCLGMQAIAEVYGGKLFNLSEVHHGVASEVTVTDSKEYLYQGISDKFQAGRYHSWMAEKASLPNCLKITSEDDQGRIMSLRHREYDLRAVQFHPESVLTPEGKKMIQNWLEN